MGFKGILHSSSSHFVFVECGKHQFEISDFHSIADENSSILEFDSM